MPIMEFWKIGDFMKKEFPPQEPIVEGIISRGELIILSGPAKTGKSFFATQLAISVAKEIPFLGHFPTTKGTVFLLQTEITNSSFQERIKIMEPSIAVESDINLFISHQRIHIKDYLEMDEIHYALTETRPDLLILDPFYTLHRGDENSSKEMVPILENLKRVSEDYNLACLLIHHQGKRNENAPTSRTGHKHRGSSSFADVPDGSLSLEKNDEKTLKLSFEFRNRETPDPILLTQDKETMHFNYEGGAPPEKEDYPKLIADFLIPWKCGLQTYLLVDEMVSQLGKSERSVQNYISNALKRGLIKKIGEGKRVLYFHPSCNPPAQECSSL
jgi:KaiC/GvpD/RAD55 family RecA-like ATPase